MQYALSSEPMADGNGEGELEIRRSKRTSRPSTDPVSNLSLPRFEEGKPHCRDWVGVGDLLGILHVEAVHSSQDTRWPRRAKCRQGMSRSR